MLDYETHPKSHGGDFRHACRCGSNIRRLISFHVGRVLCRDTNVNNRLKPDKMKDITYNVKNDAAILDHIQDLGAWELFDKLGKSICNGYGVTSPQMLNQTHCKQPRGTYDLHKYRKSGKTPTFKVSPRRGYTAIIFTF